MAWFLCWPAPAVGPTARTQNTGDRHNRSRASCSSRLAGAAWIFGLEQKRGLGAVNWYQASVLVA